MKTLLFTLSILGCSVFVSAQSVITSKRIVKSSYDYSIMTDNLDKNNIDWEGIKSHFDNYSSKDSVKISIKINTLDNNPIKNEKTYSIKGIKENLDELINRLKNLIQ